MADKHCKAVLWPISREKFVELCPVDVPFAEAVILGRAERLNLAENGDQSFILACKTPSSFFDKSTFRNSQKDLLLNVCITPTDSADLKEFIDAHGCVDCSTNKDELVIAISEEVFSRECLKNVDYIWVKKAGALPLQKVFLGISGENRFAWAEMHLASALSRCSENYPILLRERNAFPLPVDENFDPELSAACKTLFVLQCEPVQQGLITHHTEIILSKMDVEKFCKNKQSFVEEDEQSENQSELLTPFLISEFTTPLKESSCIGSLTDFKQVSFFNLEVTIIPHLDVVSIPETANGITADHCNRLHVTMGTLMSMGLFNGSWVKVWRQEAKKREDMQIRTPSDSSMNIVNGSPHQNVAGDLQGSGLGTGMNNRALADECCETELHSDQIKVRFGEETPNETLTEECCLPNSKQHSLTRDPNFHIVQLFAVDERYSRLARSQTKPDSAKTTEGKDFEIKHQAFISPLLSFNLFGRKTFCKLEPKSLCMAPVEPRMKDSWNQDSTQDQVPRTSSDQTANPPVATEAHVALVSSPGSKSSEVFDLALTRHFQTPRLLTVGDVFRVKWDWTDGHSSAPEGQKERQCYIYFQTTKLVCEGSDLVMAFIDAKHTSLYQRGVIHSFVPAVAEAEEHSSLFSSGADCNAFVDLLSPPGLEGSVQKLCDVVEPYLSQSCTLPLTGILLTGPPGVGKRTVVKATGRRLCLHYVEINCYDLVGDSIAATETRIRNAFQRGIANSPCIMLMRNIHALGKDREGNEDEPRIAVTLTDCISKLLGESPWPVVIVAASSSPGDISADLLRCFLHEFCLEAPNQDDRYCMLAGLMEATTVADNVPLRQLAKRTAGMVAADLTALLSQASCIATKRILESCANQGAYSRSVSTTFKDSHQFPWKLEQDICEAGASVLWQDLEQALDILQVAQSDAIGAPKIPSVKWEDVGGLADVKAEILDTVQLPLQHPELFAAGLRRSGVLLYGPPGTGKTLLAKAVATECSLNFLSIKGPELINMYVGQSEQNVREVFSRAQTARPCVIFFDELDSLAPNRGRSGDSGGVMDRVVSQLLAELDGLHKACDVFVIGATNRPDLLDPALLRPGRFDKMIYLGISEDRNAQLQILRALTRKFHLDTHFCLEEFVAKCPANLTGADFYALCSDAMLNSIKRQIRSFEAGEDITEDDVTVTGEDFEAALDKLVPSVSTLELERYRQLQQEFALAGSSLHKKR